MSLRLAALAWCCGAASAWPHYVTLQECAKGLDLLVEGPPPPLMGVIPDVDPAILSVSAADGETARAIEPGARVRNGTKLTVTHNEISGHGFQLLFLSSSGLLEGGEPCGADGASIACTTCGEEGFLKRVVWTPTRLGPAIVAVGAARMIVGTPAVKTARLSIEVVP